LRRPVSVSSVSTAHLSVAAARRDESAPLPFAFGTVRKKPDSTDFYKSSSIRHESFFIYNGELIIHAI
jgi:hypothetical protein